MEGKQEKDEGKRMKDEVNFGGFTVLEQVVAVSLLAFAVVVGLKILVDLRIKNGFLQAREFGKTLALQKLEEKWSQPLDTIVHGTPTWSTQALYRSSMVQINVSSQVNTNAVTFTSMAITQTADRVATNRFTATRFY